VRTVSFVLVFLVVLLALAGCAAQTAIRAEIVDAGAVLAELKTQGAKACAPKELALAEAHLEFGLDEWAENDYNKARDHLNQVEKTTEQIRRFIETCGASASTGTSE
jgi:hypothetical protein